MKKTLSILMVVMILFVMSITPSFAVTSFAIALSPSSTTIEQGKTVNVTISLKNFTPNETGINAIKMTISYDSKVFNTLATTDLTSKGGWNSPTFNAANGQVTLDNSAFISKNSDLLTIKFTVKSSAPTGNTVISIKDVDASDGTYDIYPPDQSTTLKVQAATTTTSSSANNTTGVTTTATQTNNTTNTTNTTTNTIDTNTINTTNTTDTTNTTNTAGTTDTTTPDIIQGGYTEHGNDIVFDKLVNGNVYLVGNNITFKANSGINGDLFVIGNNITFEATSFNDALQVYGNIYILADKVNFQGIANSLYVVAHTFECGQYGGLDFGAKVFANDITWDGSSNSNLYFAATSSLNLTDNTYVAGNVSYFANFEPTISQNATIYGETLSHTLPQLVFAKNVVVAHIENYIALLCFTLVILLAALLFNRSAIKNVNKFSIVDYLKTFGIGILSIIISIIVSVLLLCSSATALVALTLLTLSILLLSLGTAIILIDISFKCYNKFGKNSKTNFVVLFIILATLIYYAILLIPYAGVIVAGILTVTGFGKGVRLIIAKIKSENKANSENAEIQDAENDTVKTLKAKVDKVETNKVKTDKAKDDKSTEDDTEKEDK
ncbi:MAG: cohesin domain-containing protein [Oscillospiraceae bacterium]|nr:cohesin domain-containing protein [Oscillospiraceae bacterium]